MRSEIWQKLVEAIPEIEERVYEPHAAGPETEKPYIVIRQGDESEINSWFGGETVMEVWPYLSRTSFEKVDELSKKAVQTLDRKLITSEDGDTFTCIYAGSSGEDMVDEEWDAITRNLKFIVLPFPNQATSDPDPVAGMNAWINSTFPELQVDPLTWVLTDATPAVYWRFSNMRITEQWAAVSWIEATLMGHVLAPTPHGRLLWTKKITERIATAGKTYLSDGSPLFFKGIAADSQADYLKTGQIRLTAKYGVLVPRTQAETLQRASVTGAI